VLQDGLTRRATVMLMVQDEPKTFAGAVRQYLLKYPESSPKQAALAACRLLGLATSGFQFRKKLNEARQVKYRLKSRKQSVNVVQSDRSGVMKGVVDGAVEVDVHKVVFSGTMPGWLVGTVARAAEAEFAGWRVANDRTGLMVCELEKSGFRPYRIVAYRSSGFMAVYPGRRSYDEEDLKFVSWSNMVYVLNEMGPEERRQSGGLEKYQAELREFCDEVFAQGGGHLAVKVAGMRNVAPFKIRVKNRGLNVRHDGSDPDCIELEVDPQAADLRTIVRESREVAREVRELRAAVRDQNAAMKEMCSHVMEIAVSLKEFGGLVSYVMSPAKGVGSHQANREPDWSRYN